MNQLLIQHISDALVLALLSNLIQGCLIGGCIWMIRKFGFSRKNPAVLHKAQLGGLFFLAGSFIFQLVSGLTTSASITESTALKIANLQTIRSVFPWFAMVYVLGLGYYFLFWVRSWFQLSRIRLPLNNQKPPVLLQTFVRQWAAVMGIHKEVRLFISNRISVPMTFGYFRPIILIPLCSVSQLTENQLKTVLLHELSHIRRSDYLVNILQQAAALLLYFNPVARWLNEEIQESREWLCDDEVLQFPYSPREYAEALFTLSAYNQSITPAMAATGAKKHLLTRIQKIMMHDPAALQNRKGNWLLGSLLILLFSLTAIFVRPAVSTSNSKNILAPDGDFALQLIPIWPTSAPQSVASDFKNVKLQSVTRSAMESVSAPSDRSTQRISPQKESAVREKSTAVSPANEYVLTLINTDALKSKTATLTTPHPVQFNENGWAQLSDSTWMIRVEEEFSGENSQRITYYKLLKSAEKSQLIPIYQSRKLIPSAAETAH